MDTWNTAARRAARWTACVLACGLVCAIPAQSAMLETISPVRGHRYAAAQSNIFQYDAEGALVGRLTLDGENIRGIAWGSGGLIYAVVESSIVDQQVRAMHGDGTVVHSYAFEGAIGGNISYGAIDFDYRRGRFYVGAADGIYGFSIGGGAGERLTQTQAYSVSVMPNGDVLGLAAYALHRFTPEGVLVETISNLTQGGMSPIANNRIIDGRGVLYDRHTGITYLSMLGSSAAYYQVLMLEGVGPAILGSVTYGHANDLALDVEGMLLVGSRTLPPAWFDRMLEPQGAVQGIESLFVAVFPPTAHIFDASFED